MVGVIKQVNKISMFSKDIVVDFAEATYKLTQEQIKLRDREIRRIQNERFHEQVRKEKEEEEEKQRAIFKEEMRRKEALMGLSFCFKQSPAVDKVEEEPLIERSAASIECMA